MWQIFDSSTSNLLWFEKTQKFAAILLKLSKVMAKKAGRKTGEAKMAGRITGKSGAGASAGAVAIEASKPRQLKVAPNKFFRFRRRTKSPETGAVMGSFRLFKQAILALAKNWPLFLGIVVIYGLLSIILVGSLSLAGSTNLAQTKHDISQDFGGFVTGVTLFAYLAGSAGFGTASSGSYQAILIIFISLALIWSLRQVYVEGRERAPKIREAFYEGMAPLVQFILVLIVLALEFIPLTAGALLYATVVNGGIAITLAEKSIFGVIFFLLAVASFYMLTSSAFAAYIVTLKGMTPIKALKAAGELVRYRRVRIFLKLLFVFVALTIIAAIIIIPLALFATPVAPYIFFVLTLIFLAIFHSYVYALYRELI